MSNPSIKSSSLLDKDDLYFKAAVGRCRNGMGSSALSSIASLLMASMMNADHVRDWLKDFTWTVVHDPDRFRAVDDSRCSLCRFHRVCPPLTYSCKCKGFLSALEKEWNVSVDVTLGKWYSHQLIGVFTYDYGFIYNSMDGREHAVQGPWRVFIDQLRTHIDENKDAIDCIGICTRPPESTVLHYGIRPKWDETIAAYNTRVGALISIASHEIEAELKDTCSYANEQDRIKGTLRRFILRIGQGKTLEDTYANDVMAMVADWWPGVDPEVIGNDSENKAPENASVKRVWEYIRRLRPVPETVEQKNVEEEEEVTLEKV